MSKPEPDCVDSPTHIFETVTRCKQCGYVRSDSSTLESALKALPRLEWDIGYEDSVEFNEHPNGDWVRWSDIEALLARGSSLPPVQK